MVASTSVDTPLRPSAKHSVCGTLCAIIVLAALLGDTGTARPAAGEALAGHDGAGPRTCVPCYAHEFCPCSFGLNRVITH